jgi:hypothetical protein
METTGFFLKKLDATPVKYSAFDRELLACTSGFRHFRHMLKGRQFTVYSDHTPLTYVLSRTSDSWSARQKFDLLMKMEPMGGRKPSQQLHAMLGMEAYLLPLPLHAAAVTGSLDAARRNAAR